MTAVSFSPDARTVAGTGGDGKIQSWDLASRRPHLLATLPSAVHTATHAGDGRLAVADEDGHGLILPPTAPASSTPAVTFQMVDRRTPMHLTFSPDGSLLAAPGLDPDVVRRLPGQLAVWDARTDQLRTKIDLPGETPAFTGFTGDGRFLLLVTAEPAPGHNPDAGDPGYLRTWSVPDLLAGRTAPRQKTALTGDEPITATLDATGHLLAVGGYEGKIDLWDPATGRHVKTLATLPGPIRTLAFSPDGTLIAAGTTVDGVLRVFDTRTGDLWAAITGRTAASNQMAFAPDGGLLASASTDGTLDLWPLRPAAAIATVCRALTGPTLTTEWHDLRPSPSAPPCP
jgi:WD40 repeat protein